MKTPVRPTPALSKRRHRVHKDARKWCCIYQDTVAVSQNIVLADFALTGTFSASISAAGCLPTVDRDRSILAKLLFCFMDLADEVDESFSWLWHSLFGPVRELKLPYCPWLPILWKRWLEMKNLQSKWNSGSHTVGRLHIVAAHSMIIIVIHRFMVFPVQDGAHAERVPRHHIWSIRGNVLFLQMPGIFPECIKRWRQRC